MNQANRCDFQIHGASPDSKGFEGREHRRSLIIEWQNGHLGESIDGLLQIAIAADLVGTGFFSSDQGDPTLKGLLSGDDAGKDFGLAFLNPELEIPSEGRAVNELAEMVGVQYDEHQPWLRLFISDLQAEPSFAASSTKGSSFIDPKTPSVGFDPGGLADRREGKIFRKWATESFGLTGTVFSVDFADFPLI